MPPDGADRPGRRKLTKAAHIRRIGVRVLDTPATLLPPSGCEGVITEGNGQGWDLIEHWPVEATKHASAHAAKELAGGITVTGLICRAVLPTSAVDHAVIVAKYDGLTGLLRRQQGSELSMTFEQLASAVPGGLPPSAYRHRAWWANEADGQHVHARAWISAGWVVANVDLAGRVVTFRRAGD
jgi:hypothetical protein